MESIDYGWLIIEIGKVRGIAENLQSAMRWSVENLLDADSRARNRRWTDTHKLMIERPFRGSWRWAGIEIIPAPFV